MNYSKQFRFANNLSAETEKYILILLQGNNKKAKRKFYRIKLFYDKFNDKKVMNIIILLYRVNQ